MSEPASEILSDGPSCAKCGHRNPSDAMYCAECGFFMGRSEPQPVETSKRDDIPGRPSADKIDRPVTAPVISGEKPRLHRCVRCGHDIENLERCPVCGLIVPELPESPDEFLTDFMNNFPMMLSDPGKFADNQPYRLGWTALIQPILWTTLGFILFWTVSFFSRGTMPIRISGVMMDFGTFLIISMAVIVVVFPWIMLIYISVFQSLVMLLGGRGRIERACKAVCSMVFGMLLLLGTLFAIHNFAAEHIRSNPGYLLDSPWHMHYKAIPLIIKIVMILAYVYFLTIQIRLLARVNYVETIRSFLAHVLFFIPFAVWFGLKYYALI